MACCGDRPQRYQADPEVKNLKKAAAVTMIAGGLIAAGAGAASATGHSGAGARGVAAHSLWPAATSSRSRSTSR